MRRSLHATASMYSDFPHGALLLLGAGEVLGAHGQLAGAARDLVLVLLDLRLLHRGVHAGVLHELVVPGHTRHVQDEKLVAMISLFGPRY